MNTDKTFLSLCICAFSVEGTDGGQYSVRSVQEVFASAKQAAGNTSYGRRNRHKSDTGIAWPQQFKNYGTIHPREHKKDK
jgi:hypothetical protein